MEKQKNNERATDMEYALFLIQHIRKPCEDLEGNNIRDFYIREAERALETMSNQPAKELLESTIKDFSE